MERQTLYAYKNNGKFILKILQYSLKYFLFLDNKKRTDLSVRFFGYTDLLLVCFVIFFKLVYSIKKHFVCNCIRNKLNIFYCKGFFYNRFKFISLNLKVSKLCRKVDCLVKWEKFVYLIILSVCKKKYKCAVGNNFAVEMVLFYLRKNSKTVAK